MFPNFCGATGMVGWLVMVVVWAGLIGLAVWGITRLFPSRPGPVEPTVPQPRQADDVSPSLVDSGQR
jgi:hypothetical protein